jgi:predicted RND superfamily exporter protein
MALLWLSLPFFAYLGMLLVAGGVLLAFFWPVVLPRLIYFLTGLYEAREARRRLRSTCLAKRRLQ